MNELIIDIVCPVYKDYEQIKNLLYSIKKQERIIIKNFVCPFTLSELEVDKKIECLLKENEIIFFKIDSDNLWFY